MSAKPSLREEANAIVAYAFRNGFLEELHAGKYLVEDETLSRITDAEMKSLMIESCERIAKLLDMKEHDPEAYWKLIEATSQTYTKGWDQ